MGTHQCVVVPLNLIKEIFFVMSIKVIFEPFYEFITGLMVKIGDNLEDGWVHY
ncbi:MAG: hypothetical protein GKC53_04045 [Neisseriaceae bacterium]|nr:MAG: hypothetical protein GKC53_04045 [Neisseriaceae bacterium]